MKKHTLKLKPTTLRPLTSLRELPIAGGVADSDRCQPTYTCFTCWNLCHWL